MADFNTQLRMGGRERVEGRGKRRGDKRRDGMKRYTVRRGRGRDGKNEMESEMMDRGKGGEGEKGELEELRVAWPLLYLGEGSKQALNQAEECKQRMGPCQPVHPAPAGKS